MRFVAKLLAAERRQAGHPARQPGADLLRQAVLRLGWCCGGTTCDTLTRDHGISRATASRYLDEVIAALAGQAPGPRQALERARDDGFSHVVLNGKIIPCDWCKEPRSAPRARSSTRGIRARPMPMAAISRR